MLILVFVLGFLSLTWMCEQLERKSRRYYTDQWLLRGSGFFFGCAVTLAICGIVFA